MIDAVLDLSHHNTPRDWAAIARSGVLGVLHKASQGIGYVDNMARLRRSQAAAAGLRWGAYHFGTGHDATAQADAFLKAVGNTAGVLLALDYEPNPTGTRMTLEQARTFVTRIHAVTGRWPLFYAMDSEVKDIRWTGADDPLRQCPLWVARYGDALTTPGPIGAWPYWTLWQYTQTGHVPGVDGSVDRSRFNGTWDNLNRLWSG